MDRKTDSFNMFVEHIKSVYGSASLNWDEACWYDVINEYNEKSGGNIEFTDCHHARRLLEYHFGYAAPTQFEEEPPVILDLHHTWVYPGKEHGPVHCGVNGGTALILWEEGEFLTNVRYHVCASCGSLQDPYDSLVITVKENGALQRVAVR